MAAKRLAEDPDNRPEKPEGKRFRSLPSFTMVIRKAVAADYIQSLCLALEPVVRRVVQEEVERGLVQRACLFQRSPQMLIEDEKPSSGLQLIFKKEPSPTIFTESRIKDEDGCPLEILLVDTATGKKSLTTFSSSINLELVVLDGDFHCDNSDNWSSDFNRDILKERKGKRPLLTGDIVLTLKDGETSIDELKFTDNSRWIKSGHFRIGVRVLSENLKGLNIREGVTSSIKVKDHRGESYEKHYPPALDDEVWRLKKIHRKGVYCERLMAENISTVQDFLKLSVVDSPKLQKILGMCARNWEATINHARTCPVGDKLYTLHDPHYTIVLNPICEVMNIEIDGVSRTFQELSIPVRAAVQKLVLEAYNSWDRLEELILPLQGEPVNQLVMETNYQIEGFFEVGFIENDVQMEYFNWQ